MILECTRVLHEFGLHQNPDLTADEKAEYKQHLIQCAGCHAGYEEMLRTAAILESLPEPVPPPDLAGRIQTKIREHRSRSILGFLLNPIARLLVALKLGPHPTVVNYAAMLFYLMLTVFLIKLTFFGDPEPLPVTMVRPSHPQVRIMPLGSMKAAMLKPARMDERKSGEIPIGADVNAPETGKQ